MNPVSAPTGEQHVITLGDSRATIAQVAASLRELVIDGVRVVDGYPETATPPFADGIVLVPWPNRVEDGTWQLAGSTQQLDITEPAKHNAIHGLLRYTGYSLIENSGSSVTLAAPVFPQHGYPFHLETTVRYELVPGALQVTHTIANLSADAAPVAIGTHPFLRVGDVPTEELTLTVHASTYFDVDARLNPLAELPVEGSRYDLRAGTVLGDQFFDTAFGQVDTVGGASAVLRAPDGSEVHLLQDEQHRYAQVFTTPVFPKDGGHGVAVALEPMTAPPNAFNSGEGLRWVEPGETWTAGWGIRYVAAPTA